MRFRPRLIGILLLALSSSSAAIADTLTLSGGPGSNAAVFWINQSEAGGGYPGWFQKWQEVVTVPSGVDALQSVNFYFRDGGYQGYFGFEFFNWSPTLLQPVGTPLYVSQPVYFSELPDSPRDAWGFVPTNFTMNTAVASGQTYVFEIMGSGVAAIEIGGEPPDTEVYEYQQTVGTLDGATYPWGDLFRSDFVYETVTPEPLLYAPIGLIAVAMVIFRFRSSHQIKNSMNAYTRNH